MDPPFLCLMFRPPYFSSLPMDHPLSAFSPSATLESLEYSALSTPESDKRQKLRAQTLEPDRLGFLPYV